MTEISADNYDWNQEMILRPVGFVVSELKDPSLIADREGLRPDSRDDDSSQRAHEIKKVVSKIVVKPALDGILDGLADFSHAVILYWPHLARTGSRDVIRVHPRGRKELKKVGVFSSCSPARPNPILTTAVKVLSVDENVLIVQGLEAVDQTPVLDIKPYNRNYMQVEGLKTADWMERIQKESS